MNISELKRPHASVTSLRLLHKQANTGNSTDLNSNTRSSMRTGLCATSWFV